MNRICLVGIFKNEHSGLEEWLEHYKAQGVDHFFLTDNGSSDEYMTVLHKYIKQGTVTLYVNATKHKQVQHYNYFLKDLFKYTWVIVVDLDEFLYARKRYNTIKEYLSSLDKNVNQVFVPWKMFGSNGLVQQPKRVMSSFISRNEYKNKSLINGKCITRTTQLTEVGIHKSLVSGNGLMITSDGCLKDNKCDSNFEEISEEILENSCLHLNHYAIQSWSWFKNVKMTRGDVSTKNADSLRDKSYFDAYDKNIVSDIELSKKLYI